MTKVISISDGVYEKLSARKNGRSFTKVITELLDQTKSRGIMELAGAFKENAEEWKKIEKKLMEDRHRVEPERVSF